MTATRTFARCLLDSTLARGGGPESGQVPLEERLAMAIPLVDLEPASQVCAGLSNVETTPGRAAGV
ncbi:hypothetical protein L210DRAFT_3554197 [Boletus edulis BED1]|uniref:Uncharacterized protein n=1 Tax=Boletus edulis BED1 TaxID=1328754 RepID=A0AAD4BMF0_BOLED|nr:hypothetical protein L210DRAFT_3554197 [Boletus edulis BED1]